MIRRLVVVAGAAFFMLTVAGAAADFELRLVSQTSSRITLGWDAQTGVAAYVFYRDGVRVSHSWNGNLTQVTFSKLTGCTENCYAVDDLHSDGQANYPVVAPPPLSACADGQDNDADGLVDLNDPGCSSATDNDETNVVTPPPPGQVFLSPTGNDASACTLAAPCRSFQRGYAVAELGQTVTVGAGTYPAQTLTAVAGKSAAGDSLDVSFLSAGPVTLGHVTFGVRGGANGASHVVIDGNNTTVINGEINTFLPSASDPPEDITLTNLALKQPTAGAAFGIYVRGTDRFTLRNVEVGPACCGDDGMQVNYTDGFATNRDVTNITLDGVYMHDIVRNCGDLPAVQQGCSSSPSAHTDCIQWWSGVGVTIKNSRFYNCSTSTWLIQDEFGGRFANWTVENNMLGISREDASNVFRFACGGACLTGFVNVTGNTMGNNLLVDPAAKGGNPTVTVKGNLIDSQGSCYGTYVNNVVTGEACPGDIPVGNVGVVNMNSPGSDLHLTGTSPAIDRVPCYVTTDIDGQARPRGTTCDAGADER